MSCIHVSQSLTSHCFGRSRVRIRLFPANVLGAADGNPRKKMLKLSPNVSSAVSVLGSGPAPALPNEPITAVEYMNPCGCGPLRRKFTCESVLMQLQCIIKSSCSSIPSFHDRCMLFHDIFSYDIQLTCSEDHVSCTEPGLSEAIGLRISNTGLIKNAYCGPRGNCRGVLDIFMDISRPVLDAWLQCVVPSHMNPKENVEEDWAYCGSPIETYISPVPRLSENSDIVLDQYDTKAHCKVPMVKTLFSDTYIHGRCWLARDGFKITEDFSFLISNHYQTQFGGAAGVGFCTLLAALATTTVHSLA